MGFGNLGIAMGAGVDEWNRQRANDRADKAELRADSADMRQQSMHAAQMKDIERQNAEREAAQKVWNDAVPVFQGGWQKAAEHLGERYNANDDGIGYNDGKSVDFKVSSNGVYVSPKNPDGSLGKTTFYTPQEVMREHVRATYAKLAAINPVYGERLTGWIEEQGKAVAKAQEKATDRAHQVQVARVGADARRYSADVGANATLKAAGIRAENQGQPKGPTLTQERGNAEIDAARQAIAGFTQEDIRKRTAKTTDTGRENPDYDPTLARAASLASRRKIGADDHFDQRQQGQDQASVAMFDRADVAKRFRSEHEMDNFTLGKETPNGIEVLSKGKVVGHYR